MGLLTIQLAFARQNVATDLLILEEVDPYFEYLRACQSPGITLLTPCEGLSLCRRRGEYYDVPQDF